MFDYALIFLHEFRYKEYCIVYKIDANWREISNIFYEKWQQYLTSNKISEENFYDEW